MPLARLGQGWAPLVDRALSALGRPGQAAEIDAIARYLDEVVLWNEKTDLTAARGAEELVDLAVADAAVLSLRAAAGESWVDVGSGAGAPGLVLAMLAPQIRVTLVEPRDKRVAFLRSTAGKLALRQVTVVRGRSDALESKAWDVAVSRATLAPPDWLLEGARLARSAVCVLVAKDEPPRAEGLVADDDVAYAWPLTTVARRAVRYRRVDDRRIPCEK